MTSTDQNTDINAQVSDATLAARASIVQKATLRRRQQQRSRPSSCSAMHLVADEIETVIYGESDSEEEDDDWVEEEQGIDDDLREREDEGEDSVERIGETVRFEDVGISSFSTAGAHRRKPPPSRTRRRDRSSSRTAIGTDFSNINSYSLFDMPGAERGKRSSTPSSSTIIYEQKYQAPGDMLIPILMLLGGIMVFVLVIQMLMSLFNVAVGFGFMILLVVKVLQEFVSRPIRLIGTVHSSPVLYLTIAGATLGSLHSLLQHYLLPVVSSSMNLRSFLDSKDVKATLIHAVDALSTSASVNHGSVRMDRIMMWGLIKGAVAGIEVGCLWLIVFGDESHSTAVSKYVYRRVWKQLKRQYGQSAALRQCQRSSYDELRCSHQSNEHRASGNGDTAGGDYRNQCAICFEAFQDDAVATDIKASLDDMDDSKSINRLFPDRYQLLPCAHCFHRECARHWLSIQRSCPVCRERVEAMRGYSPDNKASFTLTRLQNDEE